MAMFSDTFSVSRTQKPLQFIPYNGPPEPKHLSNSYPSKIVPSRKDEYPDIDEILGIRHGSKTQLKDREDTAPALHGPAVIDLTSLGRRSYSRRSGISFQLE